jgi:ribosome-associated translation inhibitor RaiA
MRTVRERIEDEIDRLASVVFEQFDPNVKVSVDKENRRINIEFVVPLFGEVTDETE